MLLKIKVLPCSSKNEVIPLPDGSLKIKLKSPPVDGKANEELVEFLSEYYNIPKSSVKIKKGLKSKNKIVEILN